MYMNSLWIGARRKDISCCGKQPKLSFIFKYSFCTDFLPFQRWSMMSKRHCTPLVTYLYNTNIKTVISKRKDLIVYWVEKVFQFVVWTFSKYALCDSASLTRLNVHSFPQSKYKELSNGANQHCKDMHEFSLNFLNIHHTAKYFKQML